MIMKNNYMPSNDVNPLYQEQIKKDAQIGTDFQIDAVYEGFTVMYNGNQKLGKTLELNLQILEGFKSGHVQLKVEEVKSRVKTHVCFFENNVNGSQYLIYSECMRLSDN